MVPHFLLCFASECSSLLSQLKTQWLQAWSETAGDKTPQQQAALPAPASEPHLSHPVPPPNGNDDPGEPYTLSPGAAVAIAAAQLAQNPTQRGSADAATGLLNAEPVTVRDTLAGIGARL